jgi:hypothetical protein
MTVEAGHSHDSSRMQQHATCFWCSIAHTAAVLAGILLFASLMLASEWIEPWEATSKSFLAIWLDRIRPPPFLQPKDPSA